MQIQVVSSYVDDPSVTTSFAGLTVPASCLIEDARTGNRWVLFNGSISEHHWADARTYGAVGVVRPVPLGYIEQTVFSDRADRRGSMTIDEKLFIPCDELPLVPEKQRPMNSFAPFVHLHAHSEFCLAPETLVCTADMVWKKIGDVVPGEVLVGFDEDLRPEEGQRGNSRSKMRPSVVLAAKRRVRDCYRITLEDGTSIISSAKHGWVVTGSTRGSLIEPDGPEGGCGSNTRRWLTTERLGVGLPDRWGHTHPTKLPKLVKWASPWSEVPFSLQREASYLAGIIDGEGWLHEGQLQLAQNPGPVLDEIKRCCEALGYPVTADRVQSSKGECRMFRFAGYETALRVLSQCDPVRFRDRWEEVWVGRRAGSRYSRPVQIVSVEHLGEMETVALTTSTKTFVAEGFLSHNSPLDGLATPEEMVARAVALDQFAIAVTDHGYCAAHPLLQKAATAAGVKPIFGIEANLVRNRHLREDRYDYWHFLLLARNEVGLRNLWGASSEAHIEGFYGRPRMDFETLARFSEGVIGSTACLRGPLKQLVMAGDEQGAKEMIAKLRAIFPESLYLEIHTNALPEQIELNKALVQLGKEMSLPLVAVCDAHYAEDCDHHLHKAWIAAQTDKDLSADQDLFSGDEHYYLRSHVEVADSIAYLGQDAVHEAMSNTVDIARSCDVTIKQGSAKPVYHRYVAPGFEATSSGAERDIEVLREKCEAGFVTKRLAEADQRLLALRSEGADVETYRERLERELAVMIDKGFAGYFLIVEDYCLDPSTHVLTDDLRWVEVGKLSDGDRLLGFDENKVTKNQKAHRYWRASEVVGARRIVLPTSKVVLSDGTETVVSDDHQWLIASPTGSVGRWTKTRDLRVGQLAQRLVHQWDEPNTWEAGYIAGILDGEGWLSQSEIGNGGTSFTLAFAQKEGDVLSTALRILDSWQFDYKRTERSDGVTIVTLRGGRAEVLRLLGTARPKRLLSKFDPEILGRLTAISQPTIVSVEPLGLGEVVALETTTGTLVAQGIAHHNCNAARQGRTSAKKRLLMGPGRGSVVGSLVAYLLGITQVDPIEADLLFERFITAGRTSPPDIDLDFPSSERPAITEYITHRWGEDRVVRVGTHGRLQNKGVMRSLEKVFRSDVEHAMEWTDLVEITKIIDAAEAHTAGLGLKWDDLWEQEGDLLEPYRQKYPQIFDYAERMVRRLKSYGRHASGVVIDPEHPIVDRLPLRTAGDKDQRQVVTEFDMEALELLGYLKFDILTLRTLDTIQMCLDMIEADEFYGGKLRIDIDAWRDEYNDPQVWDMLCSGDTLGVFQIETSSGTRLVKRMQPRSIADLSAILTLVRPGPMRSGLTDTYIKRRFGEEPVVAIHPRLEPVLGRTYQSMIYQEDIMAVCSTLAGYDLEQSDKVRAILGKKKVEEAAKEGVKFVDRAVERGIERPLAEAVWAQMQEFAKYCVTGDTRIMLAGAGPHSDGWVSVEDAYRRLHMPMRDPVLGRTKTGEEFSGPCDVCGATESVVWTRGRCNACVQWRKKALSPDRGVFGMAVHPDGRIRKCRLLDVQIAGEQRVVTITLANGMSITATPDHRHLTPDGLRCIDDGLAVGDLLIVNGGYEPDGYTPERDRTTVGRRRSEGWVNAAFGEDNYGYINGGFASLSTWTAQTPKVCAECGHDGSERRVERAHLDGNRQNNDWENLRMLCVSCHKKHDYEHNGRRRRGEKGLRSAESAIVSIEDAGTQVTYDVMMDEPHIWIANGIATTNTFNRAHSWSYAVLAYWCAWLKCHFPAHFAVAVLSTIEKGRIPEFVEMTRRNGYEVLPPDVNESAHGFTVSANRLGVRYGFGSISQIGEATSEAIVQGQPYSSWEDFIERRGSKCNFGHIRTLAGVGTFDRLIPEGKTRPALLSMIELLAAGKATTCQWKIEGYNGPNGLPCTFDWSTEVTIGKSGKPLKAKPLPKQCTKACRQYAEREGGAPWPDLPGLTKKQVRDREREVLGVYLSSTPFDAVPLHVLDERGIIYGEEFDQAPNGNHGVYAMINSVRLHEDKAGRKMAFVRVNSLGFEHDITVFSTAYQRYSKALAKDTLCIIDFDRNDRGMTLNHVFPIDQEQAAALQPTQEK